MEVPVSPLGLKIVPFVRLEDDESWTNPTRPGWNVGGSFYVPSNPIVWETVSPPIPVVPGFDFHLIYPLGTVTIPFHDPDDDEVWFYQTISGAQIKPYLPGQTEWLVSPLGDEVIPAADQNDDVVWKSIYPGNA